MSVFGYQKSRFRTVITYTCIFITLGIARLVLHWWRHLLLYATHKPCTLEEATKILAVEKFEGKHSIYYVKEVFVLTEESVKLVFGYFKFKIFFINSF